MIEEFTDDVNTYRVLVTPRLNHGPSLLEALAAARRLESPDRRCYLSPTTRGTVAAVRSRSYCLAAPKPWWEWVRDWRP